MSISWKGGITAQILRDPRAFATFFNEALVTADDGSVTNDSFENRAARSVMGNPTASAAKPVDIVAAADGRFLVRRAGALDFDALVDGDIPSGIARDTEMAAADVVVAATAASALTAHEAAANPHPVYLTQAEGDGFYVALANVLAGSATYDPPSLADGVGATTTVTVTGAALTDYALASFSLSLQGIMISAAVTAANTVTVSLFNKTGGTLDIASGTLRARVWKQ